MDEKPLERILIVVETVAEYGPITLAELTQHLPFSRASIWRILWVLRKRGWVKQKYDSGHHVICEAIVSQLKMAAWLTADVAKIDPLLNELISKRIDGVRAYDIQYGAFTSKGIFSILESTIKEKKPCDIISLVDNDLSLLAQMSMPEWLLSEHLLHYKKVTNESEVEIISSGRHIRNLKRKMKIDKFKIISGSKVTFSTFRLTNKHSSLSVIIRDRHQKKIDGAFDEVIELVKSYF